MDKRALKLYFQLLKYLKDIPSWYDRSKMRRYEILQKYFTDNLPNNVKLFQDYHALIVKWGKTK
jgi:endonuclease III-like uncharacterized protein